VFNAVRGYIEEVNDTRWIVKQQGRNLERVRSSLEGVVNDLSRLLAQRLRTVDLQQEVEKLQQDARLVHLPPAPGWWQRLLTWPFILIQACIGPFELARKLEQAQQQLRRIADQLPGDRFYLCQHSIPYLLPGECVRPTATADQLRSMLAACAKQPQQQQQQQHQHQQSAMFQLLGMAGMGKSMLALLVAKELEQQRERCHGSTVA
jgi:hypothetical protein